MKTSPFQKRWQSMNSRVPSLVGWYVCRLSFDALCEQARGCSILDSEIMRPAADEESPVW